VLAFDLDLGTTCMADDLQQLCLASLTTPAKVSVVKGAFLLATSACTKAMNPKDRRKERPRRKRRHLHLQ
jgi:hypothetical protein